MVFLLEVSWWAHRALTHLIVGGALDRHPDMQLVFTEQGTAWVPEELAKLDYFFDRMASADGSQEQVWGRAVVERLSLKPSEYWARQCHVGASFIRPARGGPAGSRGRRSHHVGERLPAQGVEPPVLARGHAGRVRRGAARRDGAACSAATPQPCTGSTSTLLAPLAAIFGPRVAEIDEPLAPGELPIAAAKCPAFVGQQFAEALPG